MLEVKSLDGEVEITKMDGTQDRIINDVGALAHKTLMLIANSGSTSAEQVCLRYGILARQLVDYIDVTVGRINELED